jgi:hypothetical protein
VRIESSQIETLMQRLGEAYKQLESNRKREKSIHTVILYIYIYIYLYIYIYIYIGYLHPIPWVWNSIPYPTPESNPVLRRPIGFSVDSSFFWVGSPPKKKRDSGSTSSIPSVPDLWAPLGSVAAADSLSVPLFVCRA